MNSGASRSAQASRVAVCERARATSAAEREAAGYMTSHVNGARFAGSSLMSPCKCVVPVRGRPMMNTGAAMRCELDARVCGALRFHAQQVVEQAHDELAHGDPAERRERGLVAIRLQQPLERLGEVP